MRALRRACSDGSEMTITRFQIAAIVVGLLLAISGVGFAAQKSRPPLSTQSREAVKKERGAVSPLCNWSHVPPFDYRRGTSAYPFGPDCNFPYSNRPYGDPGRW